MHDSMDEVFETLEPACKQIDELAGTRRILSTLVRWFESVDMLQFQGQLANAKSVLHHDIDRGIEELRAFVASEDKPIFPQLLALRRMIVEWRDLDEVQKACEGTVVVQSLEDFVDGEDDAEDGRSLNNHEDY